MQHPKSKVVQDAESSNTAITQTAELANEKKANYVPMAHAAFLETKADYLCETGQKEHAEQAVEKLGIALAASHAQVGDLSNQTIRIYIKLIRALRIARRYEEALQCGVKVLYLTRAEKFPDLHLENYMEVRYEIAQVLIENIREGSLSEPLQKILASYQKKVNAEEMIHLDQMFFEAIATFEKSHDIADSERYTRLIPRTRKLNQQGFDAQWIHYSPYDSDRCFALMDTILDVAEKYYERSENLELLEFVLRKRTEYIDQKDFARRMYSGKIETMRGKVLHRNVRLTTVPTPQEILKYYPTVHQTYMNYRYCLTAPLDKEDEVWPGINRVEVDGDPLRRQNKFYRVREARKYGHENEMQNLQYR